MRNSLHPRQECLSKHVRLVVLFYVKQDRHMPELRLCPPFFGRVYAHLVQHIDVLTKYQEFCIILGLPSVIIAAQEGAFVGCELDAESLFDGQSGGLQACVSQSIKVRQRETTFRGNNL